MRHAYPNESGSSSDDCAWFSLPDCVRYLLDSHGAVINQHATVHLGGCQDRAPCRETSAQCRALADSATAAQGAETAQLPTVRSPRSTVCSTVPEPSDSGTATVQQDPSAATAQGGDVAGASVSVGAVEALRVATPSQAHTLPAQRVTFFTTVFYSGQLIAGHHVARSGGKAKHKRVSLHVASPHQQPADLDDAASAEPYVRCDRVKNSWPLASLQHTCRRSGPL